MSQCARYVARGRALGVHQGGATHVTVGTKLLAPLSASLQSLPPLSSSKLGPSGG